MNTIFNWEHRYKLVVECGEAELVQTLGSESASMAAILPAVTQKWHLPERSAKPLYLQRCYLPRWPGLEAPWSISQYV